MNYILDFSYTPSDLTVGFTTTDRVVGTGTKTFEIDTSSFDPDSQTSSGLTYIWSCTTLSNLHNCQTQQNKTLTFSKT